MRAAVDQALEREDAQSTDVAYCQAASGGDLIFLEACLRRGVVCVLLLPFEDDEFIRQSVLPAAQGERWLERYRAVRAQVGHAWFMPRELGLLAEDEDPFELCNLWLLASARASGDDKVRFICLWNGQGSDGRGGTAHMADIVSKSGGKVERIDPRTFMAPRKE